MENKIVRDFQRLRVFSSSNFGNNMEGLVQDLSVALEDAASYKKSKSDGGTSYSRRNPRKRKDRRRKSHALDTGNMSEASQSSLDEALKDYMENVGQQSDSDDLTVAQHIVRLTLPLSGNYVPAVESDSVNENIFSPVRPQRRRKKYKSMAIDPAPGLPQSPVFIKPKYTRQRAKADRVPLPRCSMGTSPMDGSGFPHSSKEGVGDEIIPGKRKRNTRSRNDCGNNNNNNNNLPGESSGKTEDGKDDDFMDMGSQESSTSSTISSSESEEVYSTDETREADDEQSDFFLEPGPTCGIPRVIPWWENERVYSGDESMVTDRQFEQILNGSFEHLPRSSQMAFKARMTKIMKHCGRDIRFGRRRLKGQIPGYTVTRFIQERHKWNAIQGKFTTCYNNSGGSNGSNSNSLMESKRQRKTPPLTEGEAHGVDESARPIPESNIGNRMLQNMGWSPGSGLGSDGSGIKTPILTHIRPRRQGLGCSSSIAHHSPMAGSSRGAELPTRSSSFIPVSRSPRVKPDPTDS